MERVQFCSNVRTLLIGGLLLACLFSQAHSSSELSAKNSTRFSDVAKCYFTINKYEYERDGWHQEANISEGQLFILDLKNNTLQHCDVVCFDTETISITKFIPQGRHPECEGEEVHFNGVNTRGDVTNYTLTFNHAKDCYDSARHSGQIVKNHGDDHSWHYYFNMCYIQYY